MNKVRLGVVSLASAVALVAGSADVNAYGKALGAAKKDGKYDFAKLEKLDSDADGVSNLDEIKKGTNPGDPASK